MESKPIIVRMEDAKRRLIRCINDILREEELNCYLIEPMLGSVYNQIQTQARNELAQAEASYTDNESTGSDNESTESDSQTQ